jgi:hypothetical protein
VAHENIGLPHFQLKSMLHGRPLAKFGAHRWPLVTHWNAYAANTQMHGKGTFYDPHERRAAVPARGEIGRLEQARRARSHYVEAGGAALLSALDSAPQPPKSSFNASAAARGKTIFEDKGKCATCHVPPLYTEPGWLMHMAGEIGIDEFQASRAPDKKFYRTTPLKGLFARAKGGFYHDHVMRLPSRFYPGV